MSKTALITGVTGQDGAYLSEYLLKKGKCICICELSRILKRDQSVVFRHIQTLKQAGIINTTKDAQFLYCCIKDKEKVKRYLRD